MIVGGPDVSSIKDLKGKKVGVELTLVEHELLLQALKVNGMSQSDVTLVGTSTGQNSPGAGLNSGGRNRRLVIPSLARL